MSQAARSALIWTVLYIWERQVTLPLPASDCQEWPSGVIPPLKHSAFLPAESRQSVDWAFLRGTMYVALRKLSWWLRQIMELGKESRRTIPIHKMESTSI